MTVGVGAPEIDLGNLVAHLDLFRFFRGFDTECFRETTRLVQTSYGASRALSREALRVARAGSLIRLAAVHGGDSRHAGVLSARLLDGATRLLAGEDEA